MRVWGLGAVLAAFASVSVAQTKDMPPIITEDPAEFILRLTLPVGLSVAPESVDFQFVATHSPSEEVWRRLYPTSVISTDGLQSEYRIADQALDDFRDVQAQLRAAVPRSDGNSRMQVGIAAKGCQTGALGRPVFSLSLHITEGVAPLVLADEMPIEGLLAISTLSLLPDCAD